MGFGACTSCTCLQFLLTGLKNLPYFPTIPQQPWHPPFLFHLTWEVLQISLMLLLAWECQSWRRKQDIFREVDGDGGEEVEIVVCLKETPEKCRMLEENRNAQQIIAAAGLWVWSSPGFPWGFASLFLNVFISSEASFSGNIVGKNGPLWHVLFLYPGGSQPSTQSHHYFRHGLSAIHTQMPG